MTLKSCSTLWGLGLNEDEAALLHQCAGPEYTLRQLGNVDGEAMKGILEQGDREDPLLCFLGAEAWQTLREHNAQALADLCCVPTVLLLRAHADMQTLRQAFDGRFQQVLPWPLASQHIYDALRNAREAQNMVHDMQRMSREISIGRELMERKSQTLDFLLDFTRAVDEATSFQNLLEGCSLAMRRAMDARALQIAWWPDEDNAHYILGGHNPHGQNAKAWRAFFRANRAVTEQVQVAEHCLCVGTAESSPEKGMVLLLPLNSGNASGFLAVHLNETIAPGKDLTRALAAARNHLAISLDIWFRGRAKHENTLIEQPAPTQEAWHIRQQA